MARYKALVAGATGIIGRRLAEILAADGAWDVVGLCRRPPPAEGAIQWRSLDLGAVEDCRTKLDDLADVTHVFYSARAEFAGAGPEPIELNTALLRNLVEAVEPLNPGLQHVHLVHGTKYYGSNLGPFKTPAKEDDPRVPVNNFYYTQQDYITERQRGKAWNWSVSRPHGICDTAPGIARSMVMMIAVYAAILKELGQPLYFPGTEENYLALYQCTDAALLARAIAWMATDPAGANQAFNITNGDYIRWCNLWPVFAGWFGMEPGPVRTSRLADAMADKGPVWDRIVARYGLLPTPYERVAVWSYGDHLFQPGYDIMSDVTKARRLGFDEAVDTEGSFRVLFECLRRDRRIP